MNEKEFLMNTFFLRFLCVCMALLFSFQLCLADSDPLDAPSDPQIKPATQEFVEKLESTIYQHGPWTLQLVSHQQSLNTYSQQKHLNIFYTSNEGTSLVWKSESYRYIWLMNSNDYSEKKTTSALFWKDESGNDTKLAFEDITGEEAITIFFRGSNGGRNSGTPDKIIHLVDQGPGKRYVETIFTNNDSHISPSLCDFDCDGTPEIITHDVYAYCYASDFLHRRCNADDIEPYIIFDWDNKKKTYHIATNAFLQEYWKQTILRHSAYHKSYYKEDYQGDKKIILDFFCPWKGIEDNSENIDLAWERIFSGAKYVIGHWNELDFKEFEGVDKSYQKQSFGFDVFSRVLTAALWGGKADQVKELLESAKLLEYHGASNKAQWWQGYFSGLQKSPHWPELCRSFPQLEELHKIKLEDA